MVLRDASASKNRWTSDHKSKFETCPPGVLCIDSRSSTLTPSTYVFCRKSPQYNLCSASGVHFTFKWFIGSNRIPQLRMHERETHLCHNRKFVPRKDDNDVTCNTTCLWIEEWSVTWFTFCKCAGSGEESPSSLSSEGGIITYGMWTIMKGNTKWNNWLAEACNSHFLIL